MEKVPIDSKDKEILDAYIEYFNAYTKRDWERMKKKFSNCLTMFGTGVDEVSMSCNDSLSFFSREFEQCPAQIEYTIKDIQVFRLDSNIAYLMVLMDIKFEVPEEVVEFNNNRTTAIMVNDKGEWKLAHGHWSQPTDIQDVGESVPYRLLKEKNRILEEKVIERTKEYELQNTELQNLINTKTSLLSIIAHDLRSPFNAFTGLTELMLYDLDENLKNPEYFRTRLQLINERAKYLYSVADNLLNWAWTQTDEIKINNQISNIKAIISKQISTLDDIAKEKEISISIGCNDDIKINTDPEILGIIVRNFVSNAIKFSHRGGDVKVDINEQNNNILISIEDKGVGISEEMQNKLLKFRSIESNPGTEKEKGIGLGLIICKELIEKLEGTLCIDSTLNKGTKITISIPAQ